MPKRDSRNERRHSPENGEAKEASSSLDTAQYRLAVRLRNMVRRKPIDLPALKSRGRLSAFLNQEEMICLTGYLRRADQIRWLERSKIPFIINAKGDPVVSSSVLNARPLTRFELGAVR